MQCQLHNHTLECLHVMNKMRPIMTQSRVLTDSLTHAYAKCEKNCHGHFVHDPFSKTKFIYLFIYLFLDSLRDIVWTVSNQYFGQPPRSTMHNLRYVLWSVSGKYFGQSPIHTLVSLQEVLWTISENHLHSLCTIKP